MKTIIKKGKYDWFLNIMDWIVKMVGYGVILIITSMIFEKTLYIDTSLCGLWCFIAAVMIYLFNKTLKPILIRLTIPITGITLGLFYPVINLIILKIVGLILRSHFVISGLFYAILASVLISVLNVLVEDIIFSKFKRGES